MKKRVVKLTEARLRSIIAEMLGGSSDSWSELSGSLESVKSSVGYLMGELNNSTRFGTSSDNVAHAATKAQASIRRLSALVDRLVVSSGGGAGA